MRRRLIQLVTAGLLAIPVATSAAVISYGSFAGTVINFDSLAGSPTLGAGEVLSNQFAGSGVTFNVPNNFNAYADTSIAAQATLNSDPNVIWVDQGGGFGGASAVGMNINFSSPNSQVGLWLGGSLGSTFTLAVYDGATLLESVTSPLNNASVVPVEGFLALSGANITRAVVYSTNSGGQNWNFFVDDLKFSASSVPEPGTLALLGMALAGLAATRRRKQ